MSIFSSKLKKIDRHADTHTTIAWDSNKDEKLIFWGSKVGAGT